jgi:regulator of protease activity HflC (stomatin/prohibitin superfamily)
MSTSSASTSPLRGSIVDKALWTAGGYFMFGIFVALITLSAWLVYREVAAYAEFGRGHVASIWIWLAGGAIVVAILLLPGFVILQPNESLVCLLFGSYAGTEHRPGFWWVNPLNTKKKVSRRLETLESGPLKVNDAVGNPVDIGAVVVWRVEDAAKALLEVGSYASYVQAQSETALRRLASIHPYDQVEAEEAAKQSDKPPAIIQQPDGSEKPTVTLRDGGDLIAESLLNEIRRRMEPIGIAVVEARISHLAYSSEIAGAMLRKQAASAVVAARRMVVKGAVGIVEDALTEIDSKKIGEGLDPERKAAMISNLLVVLVGDREITPVINTGTLYA